jgi:hypothetical protein
MPKDIDEDLIEATIRRVQAQATPAADGDPADGAARDGGEPADGANEPSPVAKHDTFPRPVGSHDDVAIDDNDPIEATIHRVRQQAEEAAAQAAETDPVRAVADSASPHARESDPISETIRRVQSQAVARSLDESSEFAPAPVPALDVEDIDGDGVAASATEARAERDIEETSWPGRDERLLGEAASWEVAARRLEQGLQDNSRQVREFAARLDAILPALDRLLGAPESPGLSLVRPQAEPSTDGEWDGRPRVPSTEFGESPRPAVLRDPSPQTATARQLEEEPVAPAAHLRPVARDSMDERLPRQYRITVEDKRRGVDLVPLHRAMQGLQNVRDMSLLSYSNGVAMVLVETVGALEPEILREAVGRAMARETLIEVHNESTMVVKVQED